MVFLKDFFEKKILKKRKTKKQRKNKITQQAKMTGKQDVILFV